MGIEVQLRREDGAILRRLADPLMTLSRATSTQLAGTRLLKYLVPWGDAVFNQAQAADLASDVREIRERNPDSRLASYLSELAPLIEQLSHESRVYLWFVGD